MLAAINRALVYSERTSPAARTARGAAGASSGLPGEYSDPDYQACNDATFALFLNGLINEKRGKKEGAQPAPEQSLTNNIIFRKLKIALDLKDDDILALMDLADLRISKHELSAFFRKPDHKHYRECKDQILRNFLKGIQLKLRPGDQSEIFE